AKKPHLLFWRPLGKNGRSRQPWSWNGRGESCITPRHLFLGKHRKHIILLHILFLCLCTCLRRRSPPKPLLHIPEERFWNPLGAVALQRNGPHLLEGNLVSVVPRRLL